MLFILLNFKNVLITFPVLFMILQKSQVPKKLQVTKNDKEFVQGFNLSTKTKSLFNFLNFLIFF